MRIIKIQNNKIGRDMGIKDVAKKAAEKATPVIKEKAVDAGRMAKVMGETVIEEKPVRSAARDSRRDRRRA